MTKPFTSARLTGALKAAGADSEPLPVTAPVAAATSRPSTHSPVEDVLIDDEAVKTMESVGARSGRDVVAKVWKLFLGQTPDALFKLENLAAAGDPSPVARQAHFLKSMSLSAGAATFAALCEEIEHACRENRLADARPALDKLRPHLEKVIAEMNIRLARRAAV
jgi:HPt (histidine-containing phosphotransfer) domain-containing protein